ncbi:MAG: competence/damage-inducible protein A [Proteobacteria bacterium]|nr:competence/damage-inducible protein A [Pseudomonadota bacterium]MBU1738830.1 competence/damage-inducible protein A [Pseudomonadota bacterium]
MIGEIIAIGDELTSGRILNTTSYFAASQLFAAGHEIVAMTTVGDDPGLIGRTLLTSLERAEFVVVTGGLGATTDDLTSEAVADALDRPSIFYPDILAQIKNSSRETSREVLHSLEKLAWLPEGAHALKYDAGMAGYFLVHEGKPVFFLPGVPHEMKELLVETVISRLAVWQGEEVRQVRQRLYRLFGLPEVEINRRIGHLEKYGPQVKIGYYPVFPEVHVSLTVSGKERSEVDVLTRDSENEIFSRLGEHLFGVENETLEMVVGRMLAGKKLTLAVAESCTGGRIGHRLTKVPGSSDYFLGGVIAYSNGLKEKLLGVPARTLLDHGAVSSETARAMAEGVRQATGADIGISVTGIAGPSGGSAEKPVGTVCFGLAISGGTRDFRHTFGGDRRQVQEISSSQALDIVRRFLMD